MTTELCCSVLCLFVLLSSKTQSKSLYLTLCFVPELTASGCTVYTAEQVEMLEELRLYSTVGLTESDKQAE